MVHIDIYINITHWYQNLYTDIYTSGQQKRYKIVYQLFNKMYLYVLFATLLVELPNMSRVQWSEALEGPFKGFARLARYLNLRVLCKSN